MLNYVKSFTMQIVPSVAATIIGAYIVNHYIVTPKPGSEAPAASIAKAKADAKATARTAPEAKPAENTRDVANLPEAGVKAKGISEKALLEKNAAAEKAVVEKPAEKEQPAEKTVDKADKPAETASVPAEPRRHTPAPREKTAVRVIPLTPSQPAAPAPVAAAPASAPQVEAVVAPEERRDANDLARAAIDRLRTGDNAPRQKEAVRAPEAARNEAPRNPEAARASEAPRVLTEPALRPLPPPIMVSTPPADAAANAKVDDPQRPTPPAEIPALRPPLDLRAEMAEPKREKPSVVDEMLSATKSVFHSVLPK
jgi:hypothetical protein